MLYIVKKQIEKKLFHLDQNILMALRDIGNHN